MSAVSATTRAIALASKAAHSGGLKAAGFRRQSNHLTRQSGDLFHCFRFQASRWGDRDTGKFTINVIMTSPYIYETFWGKPFPRLPGNALFPVYFRIGFLMNGSDYWWSVDQQTDLNSVSVSVSEVLLGKGLPFFNQYPTIDVVFEHLRAEEGILSLPHQGTGQLIRAMLAHRKGLEQEAQEEVRQLLAAEGASFFGQKVREVAKRLGLEV